MTLNGHVKNGVVVLDSAAALPEDIAELQLAIRSAKRPAPPIDPFAPRVRKSL
jgi:hypothetical protein